MWYNIENISGVMSTTEEENEWVCKDGSPAQKDPAAQRLVMTMIMIGGGGDPDSRH